MTHLLQIDISKGQRHYVAESADAALLAEGKTLKEFMKNLQKAIEMRMNDPDAGLELTAYAKRRLAYAKRNLHKPSKGITLEEIKKKYSL